MSTKMGKGEHMEEALRRYFINQGFYALRGLKFKYQNFDVTDIDLWLYAKNSGITRERIIVDIKNKKTPQAIERIFWTQGLKQTLGVEGCIVATTDPRADIREFGLQHNVVVFDGVYLSKISKLDNFPYQRYTEEDFLLEVDKESLGKLGGNWLDKVQKSKSRLLSGLDFDNANGFLNDIKYFISTYSSTSNPSLINARIILLILSFFVINIDFLIKNISPLDLDNKKKFFNEGFRYGNVGKKFVEKVISISASLSALTGATVNSHSLVEDELNRQVSSINSDVLAEFFSRSGVQQQLFPIAVELEKNAFDINFSNIESLSNQSKTVLAVIVDFLGFDRKLIFR